MYIYCHVYCKPFPVPSGAVISGVIQHPSTHFVGWLWRRWGKWFPWPAVKTQQRCWKRQINLRQICPGRVVKICTNMHDLDRFGLVLLRFFFNPFWCSSQNLQSDFRHGNCLWCLLSGWETEFSPSILSHTVATDCTGPQHIATTQPQCVLWHMSVATAQTHLLSHHFAFEVPSELPRNHCEP